MQSLCFALLISVIPIGHGLSFDKGPSLLDDLLIPHDFKTAANARHIRSVENPECTFVTFPANVSDQELPVSVTKYFVSDVANPIHFYNKVKAYGHMTVINNPLRAFSVLEPQNVGGCSENVTTTVEISSKQRNCFVAQNGGFFNTKYGSCLGNIVSDGRVVQTFGEAQTVNFGITKNGTIVVGYMSSDDIENLDLKQLVGGAIWLVKDGKSYVEESYLCENGSIQETGSLRTFIDVQSARTAIGHDSSGRIVLVNVEGQTWSRGVDLNQFASLLIKEFHLVNAINLDGGGSATLILNGTLSNYPSDHCVDDPEWRCARAVTTIVCAHDLDCDVECVNGDCVHGRCVCYDNWRGDACDELYCHHHNCSTNGKCRPDGCDCNPGWEGGDCTVPCGPGFHGKFCKQQCLCHNNATCDSITGMCSCPPGFRGALCEKGCPVGAYGTNCQFQCHCPDSCYCDPTTGVCSNMTSFDNSSDVTISVNRCLLRKRRREVEMQCEEDSGVGFRWVALLSTGSCILALSLVINVYLLIMRSDCVTLPPDDVDGNGYMQLRSNNNDWTRQLQTNKQYSSTIDKSPVIDVTTDCSNLSRSRPHSKAGHRKSRSKRKISAWRKVVKKIRPSQSHKNGYHKLGSRDGSTKYEETALLADTP